MRFLLATYLLLTINLIHGQTHQGYRLGETQIREKRHTNVYQLLRHVLGSSGIYFGNPQNNFRQNYPQEFITFPPVIYNGFGQERVVVNVNQPDSKPTTIINNLHPEYYNMCPCEKYVRANGELQCLCPKQRIFTKCSRSTVCVLRNVCDQDGLLFDIRHIPQGYDSQSDLCDESTHVCCRPPSEVKVEDQHQIYNHFVNTTVDHLNNTVTKYILTGNIYLNNGNPTNQYTTNKEDKVKYVQQQQPQQQQQQQYKQEGNVPSVPQGVSLSAQPQGAEVHPQYFAQPQEGGLNSQFPTQPQAAGFNVQYPVQPQYPVQQQQQQQQSNSQYLIPENSVPLSPEEGRTVVQLELKPSSITERPSTQTIPPNLVRPTKPSIETPQTVFESKDKEQNFFSNEITTYRPTSPTTNVQSVQEDLLQPSVLTSIFGSPNPDATVFPGLSSNQVLGGVNLQANPVEASTELAVGVSIIENFPGILATMDFPQSSLQVPMKKPEIFLTGKIEKLRNTTRTNTTTANQITQGIGQRIFIEQPQATNVFPTNAPAFNQVTGQSFSFQQPEPMVFNAPANSNPILRTCPSRMKCVQNMYCTHEGFVSTVPVILNPEQENRKSMLLNCGDESSGQIGKCCLDRNP